MRGKLHFNLKYFSRMEWPKDESHDMTYLSHFLLAGELAHLVLLLTQFRHALPYDVYGCTVSATEAPLGGILFVSESILLHSPCVVGKVQQFQVNKASKRSSEDYTI